MKQNLPKHVLTKYMGKTDMKATEAEGKIISIKQVKT